MNVISPRLPHARTLFALLIAALLLHVLATATALAQDDDDGDLDLTIPPTRLLVVDGDSHQDATRAETFYFRQLIATANEERVGMGLGKYELETVSAADLATRSLTGVRGVVLANVAKPGERVFTALQWFVSRGGLLILAMGGNCDLAHYNAVLARTPPMLPLQFNGVAGDNDNLAVSATSGAGSNLAALIDAARPDVRKLVRVRAAEGSKIDGTRLVAGSDKLPLLITSSYGRGMVVLFTSSLDTEWNALPTSPAWVMWSELLDEFVGGDPPVLKLAQRPDGRLKLLAAQLEAVETEGAALLERARKLRVAGKPDEAQRLDLLVESLVARHDSLRGDIREVISDRDQRHWLPRDLRLAIIKLEQQLDTDDSLTGMQRLTMLGELDDARKQAAVRRHKLELENAEWAISIGKMDELATRFLTAKNKLNRMRPGDARDKVEAEMIRTGYELCARYDSWKTGVEKRIEEWNALIRKAGDAGDSDVAAKLRKESDVLDEWKMKVMIGKVMEAVTVAEVENSMRSMDRNSMSVKVALIEEKLAAARSVNDPVAVAKLEAELREAKLALAKLPSGGR